MTWGILPNAVNQPAQGRGHEKGRIAMSSAQSNQISLNGFAGGPGAAKLGSTANRQPAKKRFWLWALLLQRCPRCREGRLFKGALAMNDPCPVCGLVFNREPGYFIGAMYFSYVLAVAIMVPLFFLLQWLLPDWSSIAVAGLTLVPYLPLTTVVFRYSRVIWIYFDRHDAASEPPSPPSSSTE
jgi:uncharacterized protein (DUF983 family)